MTDTKDRTTLAPGEVDELRAKKVNTRRAQRSAATKAVNKLESVIECRDNRRHRHRGVGAQDQVVRLINIHEDGRHFVH